METKTMSTSTQRDYTASFDETPGFGAVTSTNPLTILPPGPPAGNDSALDDQSVTSDSASAADAIDAWARHAAAANGFGDLPAPSARAANAAPRDGRWSGYDWYRSARAARSHALGEALERVAFVCAALVRRLYGRYRRNRQRAAQERTLAGLDDRTLRDMGFHRSEIGSVAAEMVGDAERTRVLRILASFPSAG